MSRSTGAHRHVLVIGGAGYIGSVLVRELLARGCHVRCLDALLYGNGSAVAELHEHRRFSFICGDMCRADVLARSLDGITEVVLLASLVGDAICRDYPALARDINLSGSIAVFDAAEASGVERFAYVSTCSTYGISGDEPATEESPLNPQSLYAETKVAFERFLLARAATSRCATTILRLATAFGASPRMRFDLTIADFARQVALGRELVVFDAATWRPYCHVQDAAAALCAVLEAERSTVSGQIFNVGGDAQNYTKAMIVAALESLVDGARIRFRPGGTDARNYRVSFQKIQDVLGFVPAHLVHDSLAGVVCAIQAGLYADVDERPSFYGNHVIALDSVGV